MLANQSQSRKIATITKAIAGICRLRALQTTPRISFQSRASPASRRRLTS